MTKIEKFREVKSQQDIENIIMTHTCPGEHLNCLNNCPSCEYDPDECVKCWNGKFVKRREKKQ